MCYDLENITRKDFIMNDTEQRKAAVEFVKLWKNKGDEKQHTQQFWSDLLHRVYGITGFSDRVEFEKRVPLLHTSFIDVYIPETHVIIEQKSMDIDLLKSKRQSDGAELNPFEQARRYGGRLPFSERPRWIVTCNFQRFMIYDMNEVRPEEKPIEILLEELPEKYHLLSFLIDPTVKRITVEQQLSFKAGELVGKLYDMILPLYKDSTTEFTLQSLNKLCVRIVFCLYAEDAMLFGSKGSEFHDYLESDSNTRRALIQLFKILDQPEAERDQYTEPVLMAFPYVNGGLFSGDIEIPIISEDVRNLILVDMSENLDWSKISPTIFGAVFESTLNPETRRSGGMHYTSIKDIHKVIDPLFLDDLETEFEKILTDRLSGPKRKIALENFHNRLANLHFLDPACGSGNFLTETYLSIRRLENKLIEQQQHGLMVFEFANPVKVSISQFAGIECNDFAVTVARTALWIAESQMIKETEAIVNQGIDFFPLKTDAKIVEGNALSMDWNTVVSKYTLTYIMGNPPFVGKKYQSVSQKQDLINVFGEQFKGVGSLDYVTGWFKKSIDFIQGTNIRVALVATNSICQGELVSLLWKELLNNGINILFAYRNFQWNNEAKQGMARVHCVIIGFSMKYYNLKEKYIFTENGDKIIANNINPYLIDSDNIFIDSRSTPICKVKSMTDGNVPIDGNWLKLEPEEYSDFVSNEPQSLKWIKKLVGSEEFINNKERYVLWLVDCPPNELRNMPMVMERVNKVREFRLQSKRPGTLKLAKTPAVYEDKRNPDYALIIPRISSEKRFYIPMGFIDKNTIALNAVLMLPNADMYDFGILTSIVHMAWMRTVAGRLETRYRYSKNVVYNNFPWPNPTDLQIDKIKATAQNILNVRLKYNQATLADLYDPSSMPFDLLKAHEDNDKAVLTAYGFKKNITEEEIVTALFRMYEDLTANSKP